MYILPVSKDPHRYVPSRSESSGDRHGNGVIAWCVLKKAQTLTTTLNESVLMFMSVTIITHASEREGQ